MHAESRFRLFVRVLGSGLIFESQIFGSDSRRLSRPIWVIAFGGEIKRRIDSCGKGRVSIVALATTDWIERMIECQLRRFDPNRLVREGSGPSVGRPPNLVAAALALRCGAFADGQTRSRVSFRGGTSVFAFNSSVGTELLAVALNDLRTQALRFAIHRWRRSAAYCTTTGCDAVLFLPEKIAIRFWRRWIGLAEPRYRCLESMRLESIAWIGLRSSRRFQNTYFVLHMSRIRGSRGPGEHRSASETGKRSSGSKA